jgi:hypothetical protein
MRTKKCSKCGKVKNFDKFTSHKTNLDGKSSHCLECIKKQRKEYKKTKAGVVSIIYGQQRHSSKKRKHNMPSYTNKELKEWCFSQDIFHKLYNKWVKSGYKTELKPSIDRLDDYKPYTFDNIRLTTWQKNDKKGKLFRKIGKNNKANKSVKKLDLNGNILTIYHSISEAGRQNNIFKDKIHLVLKNKRKTAGGFKWEYL